MKQENNKSNKTAPTQSEENILPEKGVEGANNDFPGYPIYPVSDDIYIKETEVDLNTEDLSKMKSHEDKQGKRNEKDFNEDVTGEDLDVPGSDADEDEENSGSEDE